MKDVAVCLREYLTEHGKTDCGKVRDAAKAAGYSRGELREAKLICQIKSVSTIYWSLPEDNG